MEHLFEGVEVRRCPPVVDIVDATLSQHSWSAEEAALPRGDDNDGIVSLSQM